jgi:hypothetical protein
VAGRSGGDREGMFMKSKFGQGRMETCTTEVEGTEVAGPNRRTGAAASVAAPSADHALFFRFNGVEEVVDGSGGTG